MRFFRNIGTMKSTKIAQSDKELSRKLWSTIAVLGIIVGALVWAFGNPHASIASERQKRRAEGLAYQAFEIRRQALKASRGPASVTSMQGEGQVGTSPDGKPYSYRILDENANWVVKLWSESSPKEQTEVRIRKDQL